MKHRVLVLAPVLLLVLLLLPTWSAAAYDFSSTNAANMANGNRPYVHLVSQGVGQITLEFVNTYPQLAFFEYRIDGQVVPGRPPHQIVIGDIQYPGVNVNNLITASPRVTHVTRTFTANSKVEIRHALGGENDWYFDWTTFEVPQCAIDAPASVNEGETFTATVRCGGVSSVYGFQFGTSWAGDASPFQRAYDAGSFVTDAGSNLITLKNQVAGGLYSVTRSGTAPEANGPFSLGSLGFTAVNHLQADGSATLTLHSLLLGNKLGADLHATFAPTTNVTIVDLWSLHLTVKSDGAVNAVNDVTATVDSVTPDSTTPLTTPPGVLFVYDDKFGAPHTTTVTADMKSHLACSVGTVTLTGTVTNGTLTLLAGDVNNDNAIDLLDSTAIGGVYGSTGYTGAEDVNADTNVNVLDLIHVGRNYDAVMTACSVAAS